MARVKEKGKRSKRHKPSDPSTRIELDSHADTSAFGAQCLIIQDTGEKVGVTGYDSSKGALTRAPVVTVAVAYDCPHNLSTYVLFFHQVLYIPSLATHLVCPFQLRDFGVIINDTPL